MSDQIEILDVLHEWFQRRACALEDVGIRSSIEDGPSGRTPRSAIVDFEAGDRSARLVIWDTGLADFMVGDSREVFVDEHREIWSDIGLSDIENSVRAWLARSPGAE